MLDFRQYPLVETEWLAANLSDPNLRLVDSRCWGEGDCRQMHAAGHLPGAVHRCWHAHLTYRDGNVHHRLLPPDEFAAVMSAAGIGPETRVVAYAQTDHSGAARLWWALRYYGHEQVAVLNGGITKWQAEGRPIAVDAPAVSPATFVARPQAGWLADAAEVSAVVDEARPEAQLLDTRPAEQYAGLAVWSPKGSLYLPTGQDWVLNEGRQMRAGHIPGAVNLLSSGNLDPATWRYLPPEALQARAQSVGLAPEKRVIAYCGVGVSASLGLFSLYLAGFRNLALYDASWEEWGTDSDRPVAR